MMSVWLIATGLVNPWLAGGVGLAAAPILIHLLSRRRFRRVEWAAMTFLLDAERRNRRRVRFEEWLLVALRCLVMALLAMLVSRPFVQPGMIATLLGGAGHAHRIIVIDDSASLSHAIGARSDFDQLRESLSRLLGWLGQSAAGDTLTVLRTSEPDHPVVESQRISPASISDIRALVEGESLRPQMIPADPVRAMHTIASWLSEAQERRRTDVYVLSDFQAGEWTPAKPDAENPSITSGPISPSPFDPLAALEHAEVHVFLLAIGNAHRDNIALESVDFVRPQTIAGFPAVCRARIANRTSRTITDATLAVSINGAATPPVTCDPIEPGQSAHAAFELTIPEPGVAEVVVAIEGRDGLVADDAFRVAVDVKKAISILLVNGDPSTDPMRDETYFLSRALAPPGMVVSGLTVENITSDELDLTEFRGFDCVLLCNVGQIDTTTAERLGRYVTKGGGLALMLGDRVEAADYNQRLLRGPISLLPAELRGVSAAGDVADSVGLIRVGRHPITAMFPDGSEGLLESVRFRSFSRTRPVAGGADEGEDSGGGQVLARFSDAQQSPAMIERRVGRGRVLLFAATADMAWHDWPRATDGSYVVTMLEMVHYLARRSPTPLAYESGQELRYSVSADDYEPAGVFRTPEGADVATRIATVDAMEGAGDDAVVLVGPIARRLGVYQLDLTHRGAGPLRRPMPINLAPVESDLTAATEAELSAALGDVPHAYVAAGASFSGEGEQSQRELWPVIWGVLVVAMMSEQALAWWFGAPTRPRAADRVQRWRRPNKRGFRQ